MELEQPSGAKNGFSGPSGEENQAVRGSREKPLSKDSSFAGCLGAIQLPKGLELREGPEGRE